MSVAVWVLLPTLLAAIYYGFVAPDEFESTAVVMLDGSEAQANRRGVLITEYLTSRDALLALEQSVHFSKHYQGARDPLAGLAEGAGSERRFTSFLHRSSVRHDPRSDILRVKVRAYDGETARRFTQAMLDAGKVFLGHADPRDGAVFTVVSNPSVPSDPTYPQRGYAILTAFLASLAVFSVGSLLLAAMREHAHF